MENYAKFVATEILKQLGGNRFIAMTGATKFAGKPVRCWRWPQEPGMPCCRWIPVA